jgi:hypothetical protein
MKTAGSSPVLELVSTPPTPPIGVTIDKKFYSLRRYHDLGLREIKLLDVLAPAIARLLAQDELSPAEEETVTGHLSRVCAIAAGADAATQRALEALNVLQRAQVVIAYIEVLHRQIDAAAVPARPAGRRKK